MSPSAGLRLSGGSRAPGKGGHKTFNYRMILTRKSLECLREMINEKTQYRSGPILVQFFNRLGFHDSYGQGFPSRWYFTDERLAKINGTPELDKCISMVFNPAEFVTRLDVLKSCLDEFNEYLAFDGWKVEIKNTGVEIHRTTGPDIESKLKDQNGSIISLTESDFLKVEIEDISFSQLRIEESLKPVLEARMSEMKANFKARAYLSVIFMAGSMLEGILLSLANQYPRAFNQSIVAPKNKDGKVKQFYDWTLNDLITVAHSVGVLKEDIAKFSQVLRSFRNYIHPFQQRLENFYPDENTAKICMQVMKGALSQIMLYTASYS